LQEALDLSLDRILWMNDMDTVKYIRLQWFTGKCKGTINFTVWGFYIIGTYLISHACGRNIMAIFWLKNLKICK
jgi:hypothetical protein